ncbi:MAG: hypothetical protein PHH49_07875, partial [Candidatus Omnitrophica bacterium]|nr:hypothetical protein [Candidatus Omnitrophota bacterium]
LNDSVIRISADNMSDVIAVADLRNYGEAYCNVSLATLYASGPVWFDNIRVMTSVMDLDSFTPVWGAGDVPMESGVWKENDGWITQEFTTNDSNVQRLMVPDTKMDEGSVEVNVRFDRYESGDNCAYLYFNMDDRGNGYVAILKYDGDAGTDYIQLYEVNGWALGDSLGNVGLGGYGIVPDTTYTLKVVHTDSDADPTKNPVVVVYLDGVEKIRRQNVQHRGERIGVATTSTAIPVSFSGLNVADQSGTPIAAADLVDLVAGVPEGTFVPVYGGVWGYADDGEGNMTYVQMASDTSNVYYKSVMCVTPTLDGEISYSVKMDHTTRSDEKALMYFRMSSDGKFGYVVNMQSNGYIYLNEVRDGSISTELANYNLNTLIPGFSAFDYHDMLITFDGASISVSVDGMSDILKTNDLSFYGEDYSSVFVGTQYDNSPIWFKDVVVASGVQFKDSMSEGFSNPYTPDAGAWRIDDGYAVQMSKEASRYLMGSTSVNNGTISTKVKFDANNSSGDCATFYFRMDDDLNGYLASVRSDGYIELYKVTNGWVTGDRIGGMSINDMYSNVWYDLVIELNGDQITFKVDADNDGAYQADETLTATDSTYSGPGMIGIGTRSQSDDIWFSSLTVSENGMTYDPVTQLESVPRLSMRDYKGAWAAMDDGTGNVAYVQKASDDANDYYQSYVNGAGLVDGTLGIRIKMGDNYETDDVAYVYFRMSSDYRNGYAMGWKGNTLYLYRINNGVYESITSVTAKADMSKYHDFIISLDGENISISMDDQTDLIVRSDLRYYGEDYADVGMGTYSAITPVWFDHLTVMGGTPVTDTFTQSDAVSGMPVGGRWVAEGDYISQVTDTSSYYMVPDSSVKNGTIDTTMKFSERETSGNVGIVYFRMDEGRNGYAALVRGDGNVYIYRVTNGVLREVLASGDLGQIYVETDYSVRVQLVDGNIRLYVDINRNGLFEDNEYRECVDHTFTDAGMVGLGTDNVDYPPLSFGPITTSESGTFDLSEIYSQVPRGSILWTSGGDWEYMDDGSGNMAYVQTWGDNSSAYYRAAVKGAELTDGTVRARVKIDANYDGNHDSAYLYFRMSDDMLYGYAACIRGDGRLYLYRVTNGGCSELAWVDLNGQISDYDPFEYHEIKISLDGASISISVDGVSDLIEREDYVYFFDNVGIGTQYATSPIWFDDIDVIGPVYAAEDFGAYEGMDAPIYGGRWVVDQTSGKATQTYNTSSMLLFNDSEVGDGTISTTIRFGSTATDNHAVVYFRMDENNNGYAADFCTNGAMYLYRVVNGVIMTGTSLTSKDFGSFSTVGVDYLINIELDGENITIKGDGNNDGSFSATETQSLVDFTHTGGGMVGIGTRGNSAPISFGDVQVPGNTYDPVDVVNSIPVRYPVAVVGDWAFMDDGSGDYCYVQRSVTDNTCFAVLNGITASTGDTIQTDFKFDGTGDNYAYLYFGMDDNNNGYAVQVRRSGTSLLLRIYTVVKGAVSSSLSGEVTLSNIDLSDFHTLTVELINDSGNTQIKAYVDGYSYSNYAQTTSSVSGLITGMMGVATKNTKTRTWFNNTGVVDEVKFSDGEGTSDIDGFTPVDGTWVFEDGVLKQTERYTDISGLQEFDAIKLDGYDFGSGSVDVNIVLNKDAHITSTDPSACVGFRMDANGNGYMAYIDKDYLRIYRTYDNFNNWTQLASITFDADLMYGQGYDLHVEAYDDVLRATMNGQTVTVDISNHSVKHDSGDVWMISGYANGGNSPVVFSDIFVENLYPDYSEEFTAFKGLEHIYGAWSLDDSCYKQTDTVDPSIAVLRDFMLKDGYFGVDVRLSGTTTSDEAVLYFRVSDDYSTGYAVKLRRNGTDTARLNIYTFTGGINGTYTRVTGTSEISLSDIYMNQWNKLEVEFSGTAINVYVNGTRYYKTTGTITDAGMVGMGTVGTSAPVYFDSVKSLGSLLYEDFQPSAGDTLPVDFVLSGSGDAFLQNEISTSWYAVDLLISIPIGEGVVSGALDAVDLVNGTLDLGDLKVSYNSSTTMRLDGVTYTPEQFRTKVQELQMKGFVVRLANEETINKYPDDKWIFKDNNCEFFSEVPSGTVLTGSIVGAVNAVMNTVTIGGQSIRMASGQTIRLYDMYGDYENITLAQLLAKLNAVESEGRKIEVYSGAATIVMTDSGWECTSSLLLRVTEPRIFIEDGTLVDDANAAAGTIKVNGRDIKMNEEGYTLQWYDGANYVTISLTDLKNYIDIATANGLCVETYYYDIDARDSEGTWVSLSSTLRFRIAGGGIRINSGSLLVDVDTASRTVDIGGQSVTIPDGKTIYWYDNGNQTIDISTLKTRLEEAASNGLYVEVSSSPNIMQDEHGNWLVYDSSITFRLASMTPQFNTGSLVESIDSSLATITIAGQVIHMPSSSYTLQWYNGSTYDTVTLAQLKDRIDQAQANGMQAQVYYSNLSVKTTTQGIEFTSTSLRFALVDIGAYISAGSLVTSVDATGGIISIGGEAVHVPGSSYTIYWYTGENSYETVSLSTLAARIASAQASGDVVEIYSSNLETFMNFNGWQFKSTSLKFRAAKSTAQITPGSMVSSVNAATRVLTIGDQTMTIPSSGCTIRWFNGTQYQTITVEELNTKIAEAHAAGRNVEVYSSNISVWNTATGYEVSSSTINFRVAESTGTISADSIVSSIDATARTITIGGKDLHVGDNVTSIQWYNGLAYETVDLTELASRIAEVEAAGGKVKLMYNSIDVRNAYDGSGWQIVPSTIRFSANLGTLTVQTGSKLEDVDADAQTITVAGRAISLPSSYYLRWYNGSSYDTVTLAELKTRLAAAQAGGNGAEVYYNNQAAVQTDDGWVYSNGSYLYFTETLPTSNVYSGSILEDIDTANGTFTIGGQEIKAPSSSYTIQWNDGITTTNITMAALVQKLTEAESAGRTVRLNSNYSMTWSADGWRFNTTSILFSESYGQATVKVGSLLSGVDATGLSFDINGQTINLPPSYALQWNDGFQTTNISIAQLVTYFTQASAQGRKVEVYYDFGVNGIGDEWTAVNGATVRFRVAAGSATINSGSLLQDVNLTGSYITIGGQNVYMPASGCTLKWYTASGESTISLSELKTKLTEAQTGNVTISTYTDFTTSFINGQWTVTASTIKFTEISGGATLKVDSVLTGVDADAGTVTIGGRTYSFATGARTYFYSGPYYYSFTERTLADIETLLDEAQAQGKTLKVNYNNAATVYENGSWVITGSLYLNYSASSTIYFSTDSLLDGVDPDAGTIQIGGNVANLPTGTYYIRWYYGPGSYDYADVTLAELEVLLNEAHSAGDMVEVRNDIDYTVNGDTIQITESYLYFRALSGYSTYYSGSVISGADDTSNALTIGDDEVRVDSSRTEIRWYDGSTYETITMAELASRIDDAQTAGEIVQMSNNCSVWRKDGEWLVVDSYIQVGIQGFSGYVDAGSIVSAIDAEERTITMNGHVYHIPENYANTIYWYPEDGSSGSAVTLAQLQAEMDEAAAAGKAVEIYSNNIPVYLDGSEFNIGSYDLRFRISPESSRLMTGSIVESIDTVGNKITIGGEEYELSSTTYYYWYENGSNSNITADVFAQKIADLEAAGGEVEVAYTDIDYIMLDGVRKLTDSYLYFGEVGTSSRLEVGTTITEVDATGYTMTTGGGSIKLMDNVIVYWSEPGQSNVQITLAELEAKIAEEAAKGNVVQMTNSMNIVEKGTGWESAYRYLYIGTTGAMTRYLESGSDLSSVNVSDRVVTIGGQDIKVADGCSVRVYNGAWEYDISMTRLSEILSQIEGEGKTLRVYYDENLDAVSGFDGYTATSYLRFNVYDATSFSNYFTNGSILGDVDASEGTITIGGQSLLVPETATIRYYNGTAYETITIAELAARLASDTAAGDTIELTASLSFVDNEGVLEVTTSTLNFAKTSSLSYVYMYGGLDSVNAGGKSITVGGVEIKLSGLTKVHLDGVETTLAALSTYLATHQVATGTSYLADKRIFMRRTGGEWTYVDGILDLHTTESKENAYADSLNGTITSVNAAARQITVGGTVINVPAGFTVYADGVEVTLSQLEALLSENSSAGAVTWVETFRAERTGSIWTAAGTTTVLRINTKDVNQYLGGTISGADASAGTISIGGITVQVPGSTVLMFDGRQVTLAEFAAKLQDNTDNAVYTDLYSTLAIRSKDGAWTLDGTDSLMIRAVSRTMVFRPEGNITSFDDTENTVTIDGNEVYITDGPGLTIYFDGHQIGRDELAALISASEAMGAPVRMESGEVRFCADGTMSLTSSVVYFRTMADVQNYYTAKVDSISVENNTITAGGRTISVPERFTFYLNGQTYSLADMTQLLSSQSGSGLELWLNSAYICRTPDGWSAYTASSNRLNFYVKGNRQDSFTGAIEDMDFTNGTVTVNGKEILLTGKYYLDGTSVSESDFLAWKALVESSGGEIWTSSQDIELTGRGWESTDGYLRFVTKMEKLSSVYGALETVDEANDTLMVAGISVKVPDGATISCDGKTVSFAELTAIMAANTAAGGYTRLEGQALISIDGEWRFKSTTITFKSMIANCSSFYGTVDATSSSNGTITVNGKVLYIPEGATVTLDGVTIDLAGLSAAIEEALNVTGAEIWLNGDNLVYKDGAWYISDTSIDLVTKKCNISYFAGQLESVDISSGTLRINGIDVLLGGKSITIDGRQVDVEELATLLATNNAMGAVTWLGSAYNNVSFVGDSYTFMQNLTFTTQYNNMDSFSGLVTSVNADNRTLTVNGFTLNVPSGVTFSMNGTTISMDDLETLYATNTAAGIETGISGMSLTYNSYGWQVTSSSVTVLLQYNRQTAFNGQLGQVNVSGGRILIDGKTIRIPFGKTITVDGASVSLAELAQALADTISGGGILWAESSKIGMTSTGWELLDSSLAFSTRMNYQTGFTGGITAVDAANGTVTIGDKVVSVAPGATVTLNYVQVSLSELGSRLATAGSEDILLWLGSSTIRETSDGWTFTGNISIETRSSHQAVSNGTLSSVDVESGTITFGGYVVNVKPGVTIRVDGSDVTLEGLKSIFDANIAAGFTSRVSSTHIRMETDGWEFDRNSVSYVNFETKSSLQYNFTGVLTDVDADNYTITVNGCQINIAGRTLTLDGVSVSPSQVIAALNDASANGMLIWLNTINMAQTTTGWNATSSYVQLVTRSAQATNWQGAVTAVDSTARTVTIDGNVINIPASTTVKLDGKTMSLAELSSAPYAWLLSSAVKYASDGWVFTASEVQFQTNYNIQNSFQGRLSSVNISGGKLVIDGREVDLGSVSTIRVDGSTVSMSQLSDLLSSTSSAGCILWMSATSIASTDDGFFFKNTSLDFTITKNIQTSYRGILSTVDVSGRHITINGRQIYLPTSATIQLNSTTVTLAALETALSSAGAENAAILLSSTTVKETADGWMFTGNIALNITKGTMTSFGGEITAVDAPNCRITVNGLQIKLPSNSITYDGQTISLAELAERIVANTAAGAITWFSPNTISYTTDGWIFSNTWSTPSAATKLLDCSNVSGPLTAVDAINGTITVNGMTLAVEASGATVSMDGQSVSLEELAAILSLNEAVGALVVVSNISYKLSGGDILLTSTSLACTTKKIRVTTLNGDVGSMDTDAREIEINGETYYIAEGVNLYLDGNAITLEELAQKVLANVAAGYGVWLQSSNYMEFLYMEGVYTAVGTYSSNALYFVTQEAHVDNFDGFLQSVDTSGDGGFVVDGLDFALPEGCTVMMDGVAVDLATLRAKLIANQSAGLLTKMLTVNIHRDAVGWLPETTVIEFATMGTYTELIKALVTGALTSPSGDYVLIEIDGMKVRITDDTVIGSGLTKEEFAAVIRVNIDTGYFSIVNATLTNYGSDEWVAVSIDIAKTTSVLGYETFSNIRTTVLGMTMTGDDTATISYSGTEYKVTADTTITDIDGNQLSAIELYNLMQINDGLYVDINVYRTAEGPFIDSIHIVLDLGTIFTQTGRIDSINVDGQAIFVEGTEYHLSEDSTIINGDGERISLAELKSLMDINNVYSADTYLSITSSILPDGSVRAVT